jgi:hypothetical protein
MHDHVNLFCLRVDTTSNQVNHVVDVIAGQSKGVMPTIMIHQRFKILESECGDGVWRIECCLF